MLAQALRLPFDPTNLNALLPKAFVASQAQPTVPEQAYNADYGTNFPNTYSRIQDTSLTFAPYNGQACTQNSDCTSGHLQYNGGNLQTTMPMEPKAIQELFTLDYGRMNATLGTELPFTGFPNQTTVPLGYADPPTETINGGIPQLWKITHNGVDTHFIHFHLFNVQVINRVGWDGAIRPPDANELGWKETVRMNPLEDVIVAVNPIVPTLPFPVPDSNRLLDPPVLKTAQTLMVVTLPTSIRSPEIPSPPSTQEPTLVGSMSGIATSWGMKRTT